MKYSIIQNNNLLVALPAEEVLTDLMFEKGWRSQVAEASLQEVNALGASIWDIKCFYDEYLAEDPLDPCDSTERYYEGSLEDLDTKGCPPDADEEDFDERFVCDVCFPDEIDTAEEF